MNPFHRKLPSRNGETTTAPAIEGDPAQWHRQAVRNALIGGILAVGAALTVALSYANIGSTRVHVTVAVLIAVIQAACVALVSMHLKEEKATIIRPLLVTVVIVAALIGLSILGLADRSHF